jgi:hypothetical protein
VPDSLDKKEKRRFYLSSIFCPSAFLGSLVIDGTFSLGGRKAAGNSNRKREDPDNVYFSFSLFSASMQGTGMFLTSAAFCLQKLGSLGSIFFLFNNPESSTEKSREFFLMRKLYKRTMKIHPSVPDFF